MKLMDLLNVKKWFEGVIVSRLIARGAKGAASALVGVLAAPWFVGKVQPMLVSLGITIDPAQLEAGAVVTTTGLLLGVLKWAKERLKIPV